MSLPGRAGHCSPVTIALLSSLIPLLVCLTTLAGCGKSNKPESSNSAASESATTNAPAPATTTAPAPTASAPTASAPTRPVPTYSAAQKAGMFVYPKNAQTHDQQLIDELDCYNDVQQQTGFNPETPPPAGPSDADIQAAQQQAAAEAPQAKGGRVRGAARGAAGGALIGGIAGDAGAGAAAGAAVGTVRGGRKQRQANEASKEQAADSANAQLQQQSQQAKAAYNQKQSTFKRGFSACLDARGYSAK
jgi:hypothetical protein